MNIIGDAMYIKKYLAHRHIHIGDGVTPLLSGLILNKFLGNKELTEDNSVSIFESCFSQITELDSVMQSRYAFIASNETSDWLERYAVNITKNEVITAYFGSEIDKSVEFYEGEFDNGNKAYFLSCKSIAQNSALSRKAIILLTLIMPKFIEGVFSKKDLSDIKEFRDNVAKNINNGIIEFVSENCAVDIDDIKLQEAKKKIEKCVSEAHRYVSSDLEKRIENHNIKCKALMDEYMHYIRELEELRIRLIGVSSGQVYKEDDDMFVNFMTSNDLIKNLQIKSKTGIQYDVLTEIKYYDADILTSMIENRSDIFFVRDMEPYWNDGFECAAYIKMLKDVFVERKYMIQTVARYNINIGASCYIEMYGNFKELKQEYTDRIPNPHATIYQCAGQFHKNWNEALAVRNYFLAVQNTIALTENINWGDYTVASSFMGDIMNDRNKIVVSEDGTRLNMVDILEDIKRSMRGE